MPRVRLALAAAICAAPLATLASTAANTVISNTATVNYNDSGGTAQTPVTSAAATVTVTLVPTAVTLSSPANQTIAQGTTATLSYTITSNANGPDTYNLSSSVTAGNMSTVSGTLSVTSISLGGTTLAAAANVGDTSLTVPYDNAGGATVNGIGAGSIVVVAGNAYTVTSVTKNAGANTATIALGSAVSASAAAGSVAGERKTFTETVPSGTVSSGSTGTQTVSDTAASATLPSATTTQTTPTVITVNKPTLTVTKLVSTDGGATYAASGNAAPGTTLIYKIIATNTGSSSATSVSFTDVVPPYLAYVAGSGREATSAATAYASATALTEGSNGYAYTAGTATVTFGPTDGTATVGAGNVLVLFFQARIN